MKLMTKLQSNPHFKKIAVFVAALVVCGGVLFLTFSFEPQRETAIKDGPRAIGMPVSVREVAAGTHRAKVAALGEVTPRWEITLRAQVAGDLVFVLDDLQEGHVVKKGDVLARVAESAYVSAVAEARNRVAQAKLGLLNEEQKAKAAQRDWKRLGSGGAPSPLVLREPQLAAARTELKAAEAALAHGEIHLGHTEIRSPIDALVVRRAVDPGETINVGEEVATLYSMKVAEVAIHLDSDDWALLPASVEEASAMLGDFQRGVTWPAKVVRESRRLNRESRLRTVFLEVTDPLDREPALLPGGLCPCGVGGERNPQSTVHPRDVADQAGIGLVCRCRRPPSLASSGTSFLRAGNGLCGGTGRVDASVSLGDFPQ